MILFYRIAVSAYGSRPRLQDGCHTPTHLPIKKVQPGSSQKECFGTDKDGPGILAVGRSTVGRLARSERCTEIPSLLHITGRRGDIMAPKPFVITVAFAHALHDVGHLHITVTVLRSGLGNLHMLWTSLPVLAHSRRTQARIGRPYLCLSSWGL